jgi:hypothetical protein
VAESTPATITIDGDEIRVGVRTPAELADMRAVQQVMAMPTDTDVRVLAYVRRLAEWVDVEPGQLEVEALDGVRDVTTGVELVDLYWRDTSVLRAISALVRQAVARAALQSGPDRAVH